MSKLDSHWRLLSPSNFLGAPDLRGRDAKVCIASVTREDLNTEGSDKKTAKVVISFEGKSKEWVPCKTALRQIHAYLGTGITADWIGKYIWLHPTAREWSPKTKDWTGKGIRNPQLNIVDEALRVWPIEPPQKARKVAPDPEQLPAGDESEPAAETESAA